MVAPKILKTRIMPRLLANLNYPALYTALLANVLAVLKRHELYTAAEFQTQVWPQFKCLFTAKEIGVDAVQGLLKQLDFLMDMTTKAEVISLV